MPIHAQDTLAHYHKANGMAATTAQETDRLPLRQAMPVWLMMTAGGWLIVGLLFKLLVG